MDPKERQQRHEEFLRKRRSQATKRYTHPTGVPDRSRERMNEPCKCGSTRPFKSCCYRPNHPRFDLRNYLTTYKNTMNKLRATTQIRLINEYNRGNEVVKVAADSLARKMGTVTMREFQQTHDNARDYFKGSGELPDEEIIARALVFQGLALDRTLPGFQKPLFQEFTRSLLQKASSTAIEKQAHRALLAGSQSIFEVVEVRPGQDARETKWYMLKDVFDGSLHEFKDPNFYSRYDLWNEIIGRMIVIDGFHTFDIISIGIPARMRPFLNRVLLYLFFSHEIEHHGATAASLETRYPAVFAAFPLVNDPLERAKLFSPEMKAFLKEDGTVMHAAFKIYNSHRILDDEMAEVEGEREGGRRGVQPNDRKGAQAFEDRLLSLRMCLGQFSTPSVKAFLDALLSENGQMVPHEVEEQRHFMRVGFAGHLPRCKALGGSTSQAEDPPFTVPSLASLLSLPIGQYLDLLDKVYRRACKATFAEYQDLDEAMAGSRDKRFADSIILDEKNAISITARDEEHLAFLQSVCSAAAAKIGREPIEWKKTFTGQEFMDIVEEAHANVMSSEHPIPGGVFGDTRDGGFADDDDDNDDDVFLDEDDEMYQDGHSGDEWIPYPQEFVKNRMLRWLDAPKTVLFGKSPRACFGDARLEPSMEMLVKQVEGLDAAVFRDQKRPSYQELLSSRVV